MKTGSLARYLGIVIFVVAVQSQPLFALDPHFDVSQYVHTVWTIPEEIATGGLTSLAQTSDGYLWIGSEEGLLRFDGYRFESFTQQNLRGLPDSMINHLHVDDSGHLWLGTDNGIGFYQNGKIESPSFELRKRVTTMLGNKDRMWIGTVEGLFEIQKKENRYEPKSYLPGVGISTLLKDKNGDLWVGSTAGLHRFRNGTEIHDQSLHSLSSTVISGLMKDRSGILWIGTVRKGVFWYFDGKLMPFPYASTIGENNISGIIQDQDGVIWISVGRHGLFRITKEGISQFSKKEGLPTNEAFLLFEDIEGNILVATQRSLNQLRNPRVSAFRQHQGLMENYATSVYSDPNGTLWVGTDKGMYYLSDGKFFPYGPLKSVEFVASIAVDSAGDLWIGTGKNLLRCKKEQCEPVSLSNTSAPFITCLYLSPEGTLYIGHGQGLALYRDGELKEVQLNNQRVKDRVISLHQDRTGTLWIGTSTGKLHAVNGDQAKTYTQDQVLPSGSVFSIFEDEQGVLWFGTSGGLLQFRNNRFHRVGAEDGLPTNRIWHVQDDRLGRLWLSSNTGIFSIRKLDFQRRVNKQVESIPVWLLGKDDGMKNVECNGGGQPAGTKTPDGKLWFPTQAGVVAFDPERMPALSGSPKPFVEQVLINEKPIASRSSVIQVQPGTKSLELRYAAPTLIASDKIRFKYRMEGFDKDWIDAKTRRTAYYTNLPPGKFRFLLHASNSDGVWSTSPATIAISIKPFFYQRKIFWGALAFAFTILGWAVNLLRIRRLQRQTEKLEKAVTTRTNALKNVTRETAILEERNRIAQELHDVLAQGLAGIVVQIESALGEIHHNSSSAAHNLHIACEQARMCLEETRRSVRALHPMLLDRSDLFKAIEKIAQQYASPTSITVNCRVSGLPRVISKQAELNVLRIAQESLSNAIRHSGAKNIDVSLAFSDDTLVLCVQDDGKGFPVNGVKQEDHSLGISGMRYRAASISGILEVESSIGEGSTIVLTLPLKNVGPVPMADHS